MHKIRMHDFGNENASNDTFHFSFSVVEIEFQQIRFSRVPLFRPFYPQIDSNAHFVSVFSSIGQFNMKTKNTVRFSIIKKEDL